MYNCNFEAINEVLNKRMKWNIDNSFAQPSYI